MAVQIVDVGTVHVYTCMYFVPQRYAAHVELHVSSIFPSAEWRNKMKREKYKRTGESVAAGSATNQHL